jgi:hypothetical protein
VALSPFRNNLFPTLSLFRSCAYHRRRACCFASPTSLLGSAHFRFSVDPSRFRRLFRGLQSFYRSYRRPPGTAICFANHSRRHLLVCINNFPAASLTSFMLSKSLLRQGRGPEAALSYAHGAPPVDAEERRFQHPQSFRYFFFCGSVFVRPRES